MALGSWVVEWVATDGMSKGGEVHADLMSDACDDLDENEGCVCAVGERLDVGDGFLWVAPVFWEWGGLWQDEHLAFVGGVVGDGAVEGLCVLEVSFDLCEVPFAPLSGLEGLAEGIVALVGTGKDEDTGGVIVEAVEKSRCARFSDALERWVVSERGLCGALFFPGVERVAGEACGFVEDQHLCVLV